MWHQFERSYYRVRPQALYAWREEREEGERGNTPSLPLRSALAPVRVMSAWGRGVLLSLSGARTRFLSHHTGAHKREAWPTIGAQTPKGLASYDINGFHNGDVFSVEGIYSGYNKFCINMYTKTNERFDLPVRLLIDFYDKTPVMVSGFHKFSNILSFFPALYPFLPQRWLGAAEVGNSPNRSQFKFLNYYGCQG